MSDIVERLRERAEFDRTCHSENEMESPLIQRMHERRLVLARDLEEAAAEIERLRALVPAPDAGWRTIDSAPKDGTPFIGRRRGHVYTTQAGGHVVWADGPEPGTHIDSGERTFVWNRLVPGAIHPWEPTHWLPLPAPPVGDGSTPR